MMAVNTFSKFLGLFLALVFIGIIPVDHVSAQAPKMDMAAMKKTILTEMGLPATATIKDLCNALAKEEQAQKKASGGKAASAMENQMHNMWRVPCKNPKVTFDSFFKHIEKEAKKMMQAMVKQAQG